MTQLPTTMTALRLHGGRAGLAGAVCRRPEVAFDRSALHDRYRGLRQVGPGPGLALVEALATGLGGRVEVDVAHVEGSACYRVLLRLG